MCGLFLCDNEMDKYEKKIIKLANKGIKRMMIINKKIIFKFQIYYCVVYTNKHIYKTQRLYQFPNKYKIKN